MSIYYIGPIGLVLSLLTFDALACAQRAPGNNCAAIQSIFTEAPVTQSTCDGYYEEKIVDGKRGRYMCDWTNITAEQEVASKGWCMPSASNRECQ
jgi:hypothetical protein